MQEQLQLPLSKVMPEDLSPFCQLVCLPLASVYIHHWCLLKVCLKFTGKIMELVLCAVLLR